jgi:hypothetical protein
VPGKSIILAVIPGSISVLPDFLSTVTPGKLPTCWFNPVKALNNELLPELGLPTNAICKIDPFKLEREINEERNVILTKSGVIRMNPEFQLPGD